MAAVASPHDPPLDLTGALRYTGGDREVLDELLAVFLEDCPPRMTALGDAVAGHDAGTMMTVAHTLKGALWTLGAASAAGLAAQLEELGRKERIDGADAVFEQLRRELGALMSVLEARKSG